MHTTTDDDRGQHALAAAIANLPDGALVPVGWLRGLLGVEQEAAVDHLLDVGGVARQLGRSPSTARALLAAGEIPGFKFRGSVWRTTPADVQAFLDREREQHAVPAGAPASPRPRRRAARLDSWREVASQDGDR